MSLNIRFKTREKFVGYFFFYQKKTNKIDKTIATVIFFLTDIFDQAPIDDWILILLWFFCFNNISRSKLLVFRRICSSRLERCYVTDRFSLPILFPVYLCREGVRAVCWLFFILSLFNLSVIVRISHFIPCKYAYCWRAWEHTSVRKQQQYNGRMDAAIGVV